MNKVNDKEYWDDRFKGDWLKNDGDKQSVFFAEVAISIMPDSFKKLIKNLKFSILDWGCAEGDGTNIIGKNFSDSDIFGLDFSSIAVHNARIKYPHLKFYSKKLEDLNEKFDIIFSSNCLEHFKDPKSILKNYFKFSKNYVVLMVPFQEFNLHSEHFYSFNYDSFDIYKDGYFLIYYKIIDTSSLENSLWPGKQILLIYAKNDASGLDTLDINLEEGVSFLKKEIARYENEIDLKNKEIERQRDDINFKNEEIAKYLGELSFMKSSKFWKVRNLYLSLKHYFIFVFLNPRKFLSKQFKKIINLFHYFNRYGFVSMLKMICRKILPKSVYIFFSRLYSVHLKKEFSGSNKIIVVFPVINWKSRWQRPQQIMSRFAKDGYKIFYLQMAIIDFGGEIRDEKEAFDVIDVKKMEENIFEITLSGECPFDIYSNKISPKNLKNFNLQLGSLINFYKIKNPVFMVHFPGWSELVFSLKRRFGGTIVFDCMDDHSGFSTAVDEVIEREDFLVRNSDIVFSSSKLLLEKNLLKRNESFLVKNGTEFLHFNKIFRNGELNNIKNPIIGYYGAINDWFDMEIIRYCAEKKPEWNFVLIGGTDNNNFEKDKLILSNLKNVFFLGEKKYSDLPGYIGYFDVCIIPFKLIPLTMATNPVKFYEYISSGKPVVSVDLPELILYKDICYLSKSKEDFLKNIEIALKENDIKLKNKRIEVAKENSWDTRYTNIRNEIINFNKKNNES